MSWTTLLAALLVAGASEDTSADTRSAHGFSAPAGFEVSLYAGDELAHDIYALTIDARGRVVVAGNDYIKVLEDRDRDGFADHATMLSSKRRGVHGMVFVGDDLIASCGDGIWHLRDRDRDGMADEPGERWRIAHGGGEHASNGILQGPDGWIYWICGNDTKIGPQHATLPGSPVKKPVCGTLVRISLDGAESEVLAHGFRNPYDIDFHPFGHVLTYDADGERVEHLPWYSPTRVFDIAQGMEHGWVLTGWKHAWSRPESNVDSVPRLYEIGRGSPTGVLVYRHDAFPSRYRDGVFAICWTLGRIYFLPMKRSGSSFTAELEVFMETTDDVGFAPVDMAVGPQGDVFVAIGGRSTRGSVFRVRYRGAEGRARHRDATPHDRSRDNRTEVLRALQPLSSWSRARWVPNARRLGRSPFEAAVRDPGIGLSERIRALEVLVELFDSISPRLAQSIIASGDAELAARAIWALSRSTEKSSEARSVIVAATRRDDARIARAAWEAVGNLATPIDTAARPAPDWAAGLAHPDRRVRAATVLAARGVGRKSFASAMPSIDALSTPRHIVGWLDVHGGARATPPWPPTHFRAALRACDLARRDRDDATCLDAVRLLQIGIGDVHLVQERPQATDGYLASHVDRVPIATRAEIAAALAPHVSPRSTTTSELDRELARLFAMLEVPRADVLDAFATRWTATSRIEDDIHYLLAATRIPGPRSLAFTRSCAAAFARLHGKMRAENRAPSRFWPTRVAAAFKALCDRDERLVDALLSDAAFGDVEHALFAGEMKGDRRTRAASGLLARAKRQDGRWTTELVALVGHHLGTDGREALRQRWDDPGLRDAIALVLAERPQAVDRDRLIEALESRRGDVVAKAATALTKLVAEASPDDLLIAFEALRGFCSIDREGTARSALASLLAHWTSAPIRVAEKRDGDLHEAYQPWFDWFAAQHPDEAEELTSTADAGSLDAWLAKLEGIDWESGDAGRGRALSRELGCDTCHVGGRRFGPDLAGVTSRFSKEDLLRTIVEPSRVVAANYAVHEVVTKDGKSWAGLMVYESPAATILQTAPETAVRFAAQDVLEIRQGRSSFMPAGLLRGVEPQGIVDLFAYLRTLRAR